MKTKTEMISMRVDPKLKRAMMRQAKKEKLSLSNYVAQEMSKVVGA